MRMRRILVLACLISGTACRRPEEWTPSRSGEIFRYTVVGSGYALDSIVLDEPWSTATKYGAGEGDTLNTLPAGAFAGADAIRVRRDTSGFVTTIEFDYSAERDVRRIVDGYRSDLGAPRVTVDSLGSPQRRISAWHDAATDFRIIEFTPPKSGIAATAVLSTR